MLRMVASEHDSDHNGQREGTGNSRLSGHAGAQAICDIVIVFHVRVQIPSYGAIVPSAMDSTLSSLSTPVTTSDLCSSKRKLLCVDYAYHESLFQSESLGA